MLPTEEFRSEETQSKREGTEKDSLYKSKLKAGVAIVLSGKINVQRSF